MANFTPQASIRRPQKGLLCFSAKLQKKPWGPLGVRMGRPHSYLCRCSAEERAEVGLCPHPASWPWRRSLRAAGGGVGTLVSAEVLPLPWLQLQ